MTFGQITIIGVGLIGGSFAMAVRNAGFAHTITGWDTDPEALEKAREYGIIDHVETSFSAGRQCDAGLVYISTPVTEIVKFLGSHGAQLRPGCLVTDAGSTKRHICEFVSGKYDTGELSDQVEFVGGHPMAGSHRTGVAAANPDLFRGAPYAVVPLKQVPREAAGKVRELVLALGAKPVTMTPDEHDIAVAMVSHAPQLVSTALALSVAPGENKTAWLELAGSGFTDSIRLAASQWGVWSDICQTNADNISASLTGLIQQIERIRNDLNAGEFESLGESFSDASRLAMAFLESRESGV
ncbi:MAG TPA: prephenate dehydrogenase/arogenate dehydrogenase family protein [Blastocatellia bacterium]|nr:prephenate dehydrogenase/arogenate dehydrogenase family protein [Blastocatellia bacterium]